MLRDIINGSNRVKKLRRYSNVKLTEQEINTYLKIMDIAKINNITLKLSDQFFDEENEPDRRVKLLELTVETANVAEFANLLKEVDQYDLDYILNYICDQENENGSREQMVKLLIEKKANAGRRIYGKAALHCATARGYIEILPLLVPRNEDASLQNGFGDTALHCLFDSNRSDDLTMLRCLKVLVDTLNINLDIPNAGGYTAIHLAATKEKWDCVQYLLDKNANIDIMVSNESARILIEERKPEMIEQYPKMSICSTDSKTILFEKVMESEEIFLSHIKPFKDLNVNANNGQFTILQATVNLGYHKATGKLLKLGADINMNCGDTRNPVMLAAELGNYEVLELLIENGPVDYSAINSKIGKSTILHYAVKSKTANPKCVKLILERGLKLTLNINAQDSRRNTALHYTVENESNEITELLLEYGANIFILNDIQEPPLASMNLDLVNDYLDSRISNEGAINKNYALVLNFGFLKIPSIDNRLEMDSLNLISKSQYHRPLLNHPIIKAFLHLKWHRFFWFFYINFTLLSLFTLSMNVHIYNLVTYPYNINTTSGINDIKPTDTNAWETVFKYITAVLWVYLILREFTQMLISSSLCQYVTQLVNLVELGLIISCGVLLFAPTNYYAYHSVSAVAVLLVFTELILLIGRHPGLTTYFTMFYTVSKNFILFLLFYSFLIFAFGMSFYILFKHCESEKECEENVFKGIGTSLFKTVIMLHGELEASDIKFDSIYIISHIIFLFFCFFMVIVLMNLLNGLAVSDIQVIKKEAEIICCEGQVKTFSNFEQILFDRDNLLYKVFKIDLSWLQNCVLLLSGLLPKNELKIHLYEWNRMSPDVRNCCSRSCLDCNTGNLCCLNFQCLRNEHLKKTCSMFFVLENLLVELQEINTKNKKKNTKTVV